MGIIEVALRQATLRHENRRSISSLLGGREYGDVSASAAEKPRIQTTNLGVRSSNLFGRAISVRDRSPQNLPMSRLRQQQACGGLRSPMMRTRDVRREVIRPTSSMAAVAVFRAQEVCISGARPSPVAATTEQEVQEEVPTIFFSIMVATSSSVKPASRRIACECSLSRGGMRWISAGVSEKRAEGRACLILPSLG